MSGNAAEEIGVGGLAVLGTLGTVCAVLLRSAHQNLITLDIMRRDATAATKRLRKELREHDDTIFRLQEMCADYRFAIAKLEAERDALKRHLKETQRSSTAEKTKQFKRNPEDVL